MPNSDFFKFVKNYGPSNGCTLIINGNGHTISNAYIYPNHSLFCIDAGSGVNTFTLNDLKIEAITNDSLVLRSYAPNISINNSVFNIKCYNLANTDSSSYIDRCPISIMCSNNDIKYFTNCVFNFYVASSGSSSYSILIYCDTSNSSYQPKYYFEACIFKIRNFADNDLNLFGCSQVTLDNCAIFYNYVGNDSPSKLYVHHETHKGYSTKIQNTYFTSFGTATNPKPIIGVYYATSADYVPSRYILSSFYDSDKVNCKGYYYTSTGWRWETLSGTDNCYPLTTAQCKDPSKLSEIGYIFAEET